MVWVDTNLLARREWEHVLLLMLIWRGRTTNVSATSIRRAQHHGLAVVDAVTRAVIDARGGGFARKLSG